MSIRLGRDLLRRVVSFLLVLVVVFCFFGIPRAQAFAAEAAVAYGIKELIAAILVAGGVIFATSDDARAAAGAVFDYLDAQASSALITLSGIVSTIGLAGSAALGAGVLISASLWDVLSDAFMSLVSTGGLVVNGSGSFTFTFSSFSDAALLSWLDQWATGSQALQMGVTSFSVPNRDPYSVVYGDDGSITCMQGDTVYRSFSALYCEQNSYVAGVFAFDLYYSEVAFPAPAYFFRGSFYLLKADGTGASYSLFTDRSIRSVDYQTSSIVIPYEGDLVWPGEDTLVKAPDLPDVQTDEDTDQPIIAYPDLSLNPADHVADVPIDAAGDRVDVPTDTLVDVSTGEIVDTDVNPDVDVPDTPSDGFWDSPSDFRLNFDAFKNSILVDRFPFSIPFDLVNSVRVFAATAQNFQFHIDLDTRYWGVHHTVDLSPFVVIISFFRYTCVVWFCWVLITRTRDMIKW